MTLWIAGIIFLLALLGLIPTLIRKKRFELNLSMIIIFTVILYFIYILFAKNTLIS